MCDSVADINPDIPQGTLATVTGTGKHYIVGVNGAYSEFGMTNPSINNSPGRALVSSTSAQGFLISSTRWALVFYEGLLQTTSTIGGSSSGSIFLEIADTNSTTPSDWTSIAEQKSSEAITLAALLQDVAGSPWSIARFVPPGKYTRIRSQTNNGTVTPSINTYQQEVLLF